VGVLIRAETYKTPASIEKNLLVVAQSSLRSAKKPERRTMGPLGRVREEYTHTEREEKLFVRSHGFETLFFSLECMYVCVCGKEGGGEGRGEGGSCMRRSSAYKVARVARRSIYTSKIKEQKTANKGQSSAMENQNRTRMKGHGKNKKGC
jgi:hypothetical protein